MKNLTSIDAGKDCIHDMFKKFVGNFERTQDQLKELEPFKVWQNAIAKANAEIKAKSVASVSMFNKPAPSSSTRPSPHTKPGG